MPTPRLDISKESLARVCRMYPTSRDAAKALGVSQPHFNRLCRRYGVETPRQRRTNRS